MIDTTTLPAIGSEVGAGRWPMKAAHPGCWGKPWKGILLAVDDPRAWAGTLAFPSATPDPVAVKAHVAWCRSQGLLRGDRVSVLWDFGSHGFQNHWERTEAVRPYAEDLAAWEAEHTAARGSVAGARRRGAGGPSCPRRLIR